MANEFRTHLMDFHDFPNDSFYMNRIREFEEVRVLLKNLGKPPVEKGEKVMQVWLSYVSSLRSASSFCKPFFLDYQEYNRKF